MLMDNFEDDSCDVDVDDIDNADDGDNDVTGIDNGDFGTNCIR